MYKRSLSSVQRLGVSILICEGAGILSGLLSADGIRTWFTSLEKPSWNPPSFVFGPVWTVLYLLMAISLWLIWNSELPVSKGKAYLFFTIQLFLNFCWSIIFFRFHSPALAFVDITFMIISIILTMFSFVKISRTATWLLVPYVLWVCFAAILNYTIWILNK